MFLHLHNLLQRRQRQSLSLNERNPARPLLLQHGLCPLLASADRLRAPLTEKGEKFLKKQQKKN